MFRVLRYRFRSTSNLLYSRTRLKDRRHVRSNKKFEKVSGRTIRIQLWQLSRFSELEEEWKRIEENIVPNMFVRASWLVRSLSRMIRQSKNEPPVDHSFLLSAKSAAGATDSFHFLPVVFSYLCSKSCSPMFPVADAGRRRPEGHRLRSSAIFSMY